MPKIYDLCAPNGTYNDPNTGEEKTRWLTCGALIEKANGKRAVKIEQLPIEFNGWLECVVSKPKGDVRPAAPSPPAQAPDDFSDKIPFFMST